MNLKPKQSRPVTPAEKEYARLEKMSDKCHAQARKILDREAKRLCPFRAHAVIASRDSSHRRIYFYAYGEPQAMEYKNRIVWRIPVYRCTKEGAKRGGWDYLRQDDWKNCELVSQGVE